MRPLPRVFAVTDLAIVRDPDFGIKAAAIAAAGSAVAIVVRAPEAAAAERLALTDRARALTRPPEASTFAHGDPAIALAAGAQGVQLRCDDLDPALARRVFPTGWIGVSVHDRAQAERAVAAGADYLVFGTVFPSASHPGRAPQGLDRLGPIAALGRPVVAIGGITPDRAREVRAAGAFGVAAISALWHATDPARAAERMTEACE